MKTLTKLALSNNRKNKTRSVLMAVTVLLTTMLLMAVATFGYGVTKTDKENAENIYGSYYGCYQSVKKEQIEALKKRGEISAVGLAGNVGQVRHEEKTLNLFWADELTRRLTNLDLGLLEGVFPEKENEIAAPEGFFESLGYEDARVGDQIVLEYRRNLEKPYEKGTFVISGILKEANTGDAGQGYTGYVSREFFASGMPEEELRCLAYIRLDDSVNVTYDTSEQVLKELAAACGIAPDRVSKNTPYLRVTLDPGWETLSVCAAVILMVIFFSVMVIYNIFQVGIARKIQEYGKIKAMGATKRQMKQLVFREGMLLAGIAVPIGLAMGFFVGKGMLVWITEQMRQSHSQISIREVPVFSPFLVVFVALLSFGTVWLALKRPMKIAAAISPVEAMRYQERFRKEERRRKGRRQMGVFGLMLAELSARRHQTFVTILTMGLSCVLFVVLSNVVGNMDEEYDARRQLPYGQFAVRLDYATRDTAYPENNLDQILRENPLDEDTVREIAELEGVTQVSTRKILANAVEGGVESVLVYGQDYFEMAKEQSRWLGNSDYGQAMEEDGIFLGWASQVSEGEFFIGEKVSMTLTDGEKSVTYPAKIQGAFGSSEGTWVMTEETYRKLGFSQDANEVIYVDCRAEDREKVQAELSDLIGGMEHVKMESYEEILELSRVAIGTMKGGAYAFLIVVGLIGFMNMANTMIISIITRKREFGILQAIGMTNRQLNWILWGEGLLFTMGTVIVALAVGIPLGYGVFSYIKSAGWIGIHIYHFPWREISFMAAVIALLQLILSFLLSRNVKKESLIQRIRYQE